MEQNSDVGPLGNMIDSLGFSLHCLGQVKHTCEFVGTLAYRTVTSEKDLHELCMASSRGLEPSGHWKTLFSF